MSAGPPPLTGIRVLEFAGLAPGPFAGLMLADYGATVIRIDRAIPGRTHSGGGGGGSNPPAPTSDQLVRRKTSIAIDIKNPGGAALVKALLPHVDVVIDPFRPGVLEKAGLGPDEVMVAANPRLVVARMTGFRRDGRYSGMAGHDINYIAVSGALSMLGRAHEAPSPPANVLGDFAGGGMVCFVGILLALLSREATGRGQVVEANMVDGSAILTTYPRLASWTKAWSGKRGTNVLDGGCPFYDTYETKDGKYMAVGALEPQFYSELIKGLGVSRSDMPGPREDRKTWQWQRDRFTAIFRSRTRAEWEQVFDGTDACCTPVLDQRELRAQGFQQRPAVTLRGTPGLATAKERAGADERNVRGQGAGVHGEGFESAGLRPGEGGEEVLSELLGWKRGIAYDIEDGGLVKKDVSKL